MTKLTLNFFGEEVVIDCPKDIPSLRAKISEKYLFSPSDAAEIILYYIKDNKKAYIINGNDFSKFKTFNISTIFLDINQNSKLYLDNASQLDKGKEKMKKELDELEHKYKQLSKKKEKIEHTFEQELKQINMKIMEMNKRKCDIIKRKDIELIKMIKEKEHFEGKIYSLQKKLSLPITVQVPKEEQSKEISLKNSPKQIAMLKSFQNNLRYAPIKNLEIQKRIDIAKCRAIASAKAISLNIENKKRMEIEISKSKAAAEAKANALKICLRAKKPNKKVDIKKHIANVKTKSIAKAKEDALKVGERMKNGSKELSKDKKEEIKKNNKSREELIKNKIDLVKMKSIEKAKLDALKVGQRMKEVEISKKINLVKAKTVQNAKVFALKVGQKAKEEEIKRKINIVKAKSIEKAKEFALKVGQRAKMAYEASLNTVSVFEKVNQVLGQTIDKVEKVAKDSISKQIEEKNKEEEKDEKEKLKKEEELKKLREKEKKEKIDNIIKITKDTVNEINNLTKMVITQSNILIDQINNPDKNLNISADEIILRASKKEVKVKEGIHFHVVCDGCKKTPIRGNRYKCKKCPDFDFCESCYEKNKETHGHEFTKIPKPRNTRRMGHKNTKYCQRGIVHSNIRCEGCGLEPLVGWRYMCTICDDYNLCENCEEVNAVRHGHPFIKVRYPSLLNSFNNCYLKMNYYEPNMTQ